MDKFTKQVEKIEAILEEMELINESIPTLDDEKKIDAAVRKITLLAIEVEKLTKDYSDDEYEATIDEEGNEWELF